MFIVYLLVVACACVVLCQHSRDGFKGCPFIENIFNASLIEMVEFITKEQLDTIGIGDFMFNITRKGVEETELFAIDGCVKDFKTLQKVGPVQPSKTPDNITILSFDLRVNPMEITYENYTRKLLEMPAYGKISFTIEENLIKCFLSVKTNSTTQSVDVRIENVTLYNCDHAKSKVIRTKKGKVIRWMHDHVADMLLPEIMDIAKVEVEKLITYAMYYMLKNPKIIDMCKEMFKKGSTFR